ncbi:hypothetical protein F511_41646 [Dorcoceras hygrometricum]|uniref:Uncharacterized protein n=1 Tax=Dorcoceras hygrometricum TaxID=472368 RepID=A0A2Z7ACM7_9LAMI|nr:hypothetical protein F511_41646 [Dorcoceras hygrometricum]
MKRRRLERSGSTCNINSCLSVKLYRDGYAEADVNAGQHPCSARRKRRRLASAKEPVDAHIRFPDINAGQLFCGLHLESNKNWAYSDFETTSSSSSSESEQKYVHCLMANQYTDDEVFGFSNSEFTREELINVLNEMVHEYRKLSQTFEEIKAENGCLKNSSVESSTAQLEDTDS